jgi:beta-ureidopropionase
MPYSGLKIVETSILYNYSVQSKLEFSQDITEESNAKKVELAGYKIHAGPEQLRKPRTVRIGAVQHKIVLSTTAPVAEQVNGVVNSTQTLSCQIFRSCSGGGGGGGVAEN